MIIESMGAAALALQATTDAAEPAPDAFRQAQIDSKYRMGEHRAGKILAGADVNAPIVQKAHGQVLSHPQRTAFQHRALEGSGYVTREGESFARRARPKIKGKAAKKAAKRARSRQREQAQR